MAKRESIEPNIDGLLLYLAEFETPDYQFGSWMTPGKFHPPHFSFNDTVTKFYEAVYEFGWIDTTFDWSSWEPVGQTYVESPELIATADEPTIRRLITMHIRGDRYCDGHLAAMFENGHMLALLRRLKDIRDESPVAVTTTNGVLVIVPCGQKKVWDRTPSAGPTAAKDAYIGPPFGINRAFAERFGNAWVILSAKYGFIKPEFMIPAPYNITFKNRRTGPITTDQLREQIQKDNLACFTTVIGLGGKEYREAIELAFAGVPARLCFPFSGLPIGKAMQATKRAIATNDPMWKRKNDSLSSATNSAAVDDVCHDLHQLLNGLPACRLKLSRV